MRKGVLEYCILAILSDKEAYPSEIIERLKEVNLLVVEGTLYPLLMRLKNEGRLSYRFIESPSGPPRKYYQLTPEGTIYFDALHNSWGELVKSVESITKIYKSINQ